MRTQEHCYTIEHRIIGRKLMTIEYGARLIV